jgi:hypothetical protein
VINCVASCCCCGLGFSGYEAATVWRRVQEERPSCSTSGGHSVESTAVAGVAMVGVDFDVEAFGLGFAFAISLQLRMSVHERHLNRVSTS